MSWRLHALRVRCAGRLAAAPGVRVGRGVRVRVGRGGRVELGPGAVLASGARIDAAGGRVALAAGARMAERAVIQATASVEVAAGAVIGPWAIVADTLPGWEDPETPIRRQPRRALPVEIGERAVIGPHAVVLAGARIAPGVEVGPYEVRGGDAAAAVGAPSAA